MPDTDTIPTNGHSRAPVADGPNVGGDGSGVDENVTTVVRKRRLRQVDAEQARLRRSGPRTEFIDELLEIALRVSAQRKPVTLEDELAGIIRPANGPK